MAEAEHRRGQQLLLKRLAEMGVRAELLPGERCAVGVLTLGAAPFSGPDGDHHFERVRFSTVGPHKIKCLEPEALFQLPLIPIGECTSVADIEDRIRAAWKEHIDDLTRASERLERAGIEFLNESGGAGLSFGIGVEDETARARLIPGGRLALPTRGPLEGRALKQARDRCLRLGAWLDSTSEIEIHLTTHLEQLARKAEQLADLRRAQRGRHRPPRRRRGHRTPEEGRRVLLVGKRLGGDPELARCLGQLGYAVMRVPTATQALAAFERNSFDVVLTDASLGRLEGIELIPALHSLPGISALPVVLVDDHLRESRRDAARSVGAAGYLVHPVSAEKIARGLSRMARGERGRRFSRIDRHLAVSFADPPDDGFTTALGRRGMFVRTGRDTSVGTRENVELSIPELGRTIHVEAETVYRVESRTPGVGLRFLDFPENEEGVLIETLRALERRPAAV